MGSGSPQRLLSLPVEQELSPARGAGGGRTCPVCHLQLLLLPFVIVCTLCHRVTKPQTGTWDGPSQPGFAESEQMGAEAEGLRGKRTEQM